MKILRLVALLVAVGFILLLVVGFENVLGIFRYRVTLFLLVGPLVGLFLWCAYKAFAPTGRSEKLKSLRDPGEKPRS